MTISTLDISLFTKANSEERKKFTEELLASLTRYGFVKFVNHGISDQSVKEIFHWVAMAFLLTPKTLISKQTRAIFDIPLEEKLKIMNLPGPRPQRGWSCVGAERTGRLYLSGLGETDLENILLDVRVCLC